MAKSILLQIIIKSLDRIEIKIDNMNKRIQPQLDLANTQYTNKSDHDITCDMLLRIEKDLEYLQNIE